MFWHRPRADVDSGEYEDLVRAFHARLNLHSASFRVDELPFAHGGDNEYHGAEYQHHGPEHEDRIGGYEDWYLVGSWAELGGLNLTAISDERREPHDAVAKIAADGWGAVYALVRGDPRPPACPRWMSKPRGESYEAFLDRLQAPTVWQRQMALGPAPEFCLAEMAEDDSAARAPGWSRRIPVYDPSRASSRSSS